MDADEVGALFYTSGTTGRPKGAELSHKGLLGGLNTAALLPAGLRDDEAVFSLPMAHIMGFIAAAGMACAGIPVRFVPRFEPEVILDELEQRRASIFVGVPAMYRMLLDAGAEGRDLSSVRLWVSGADAMPAELSEKFVNMGAFATLPRVGSVGRAVFAEGYGMVESAGSGALRVSLPFLPDALSRVGIPSPGYHTKVVGEDGKTVRRGEVGELLLSGPGLLKGYRGDEEATDAVFTEDGWLRTGDLVRRGPFGAFTFEGRAKDIIVRGGYNVYAVEVEQALERHPAVAEAAVVGLPDERLGEVPVAAVILAASGTASEDDIRAWAKEQLSSYKVPVKVKVVEELPHSGTRKVQRAEVRALFAADA
jgi:acyl-CoA synthetase (AMP-forming)/AMP-acid ligase II